jgi:anti-anti-sigma factor
VPTLSHNEVQDGLLHVHLSVADDQVRLALRGELDLANAKTLETSLLEAFASEKQIVVDLGELEFLDSTGVSLLVTAMARPDASKLTFLPSGSPEVGRLLSLTGLDARMFPSV